LTERTQWSSQAHTIHTITDLRSLPSLDAGHRVGYEDAFHFTREYKRLFGEPPLRDVQRVRTAAAPAADL
jgi:AraC-like DNA-binding protein